jgi:hypothetical protein
MSEKFKAPADLPDTGRNALPDTGRNALPPLGGPPLEFPKVHEYSNAPYSNAVASFADAVTKS